MKGVKAGPHHWVSVITSPRGNEYEGLILDSKLAAYLLRRRMRSIRADITAVADFLLRHLSIHPVMGSGVEDVAASINKHLVVIGVDELIELLLFPCRADHLRRVKDIPEPQYLRRPSSPEHFKGGDEFPPNSRGGVVYQEKLGIENFRGLLND